ncbi:hypothetical protein [Metabacillus arenae]|uniref:Uncharacterized protein n=1 Tax=Metabacillus arenae TaxID=2771434 RepID=A0A926NDI8_9BACI|nr:hypothetical protein [Metabacillus arenae]MBD1379165.1 hypothetical protein [Metabacillus arenae]
MSYFKSIRTGRYLKAETDLHFDDDSFIKAGTMVEVVTPNRQYEGFVSVLFNGNVEYYSHGTFAEV